MTQGADAVERDFDLGDAAFHVFKYAGSGRMGGLILIFAVYAILHILFAAGLIWAVLPFFENFYALAGNEPETPAEFFAATSRIWLMSAAAFLFYWIVYAVFDAALLRWFYGRSAMPRFGGGEFQLMIISVFWVILMLLVWVPNMVLLSAGAALESTALMAGAVLFILVSLWLMIWVGVKFAPAAALTIHDRRFSFFRAFGATKDVFWTMLGAFVIAYLIYFAISFAVSTIGQVVLVVVAGMNFGEMMFVDPDTVSDEDIMAMFEQFLSRDALIIIGVLTFVSLIPQFLLQASFAGINAYRVKQRALLDTPPPEAEAEIPAPVQPGPAGSSAEPESEEDAGTIPVAATAAVAPVAMAAADQAPPHDPAPDEAESAQGQAEPESGDAEEEEHPDPVTGAIAALEASQHEAAEVRDDEAASTEADEDESQDLAETETWTEDAERDGTSAPSSPDSEPTETDDKDGNRT
ncbi:MAG: hypothetical protein H2040_02710 [Euryhalocaulis sp.]|uniref:hypothetical protein n=1 Tax=Euryhalocaulis sp. TaxID=2744307 RepID=UPI0017A630FE|nr:hypothetical protein [Euryhalocaulis sp.]MBA4800751.1 hypothetical protein [Euryhalocaulis sp.]